MEFSLKYLILFLLLIITLIYVGPILGGEFYNLAIGKINNITGIQNNTLNEILGNSNIKDCSNIKVKCTDIQQQKYNEYILTQQVYGTGNSYINQISGDKYLTLSNLNGIKFSITSTSYIFPNILNIKTFKILKGESIPIIHLYKRTTIGSYSFKNNEWLISYKYNNESLILKKYYAPLETYPNIIFDVQIKEITKTQILNKNFDTLLYQFKKNITKFMAGKNIVQIINNKNYGNISKVIITIPANPNPITIIYSKDKKMKVDYQNKIVPFEIINYGTFPYLIYTYEKRNGIASTLQTSQYLYTTLYYNYTCRGIKRYNLKQGTKNNPVIISYINFDLRCLGTKPQINGIVLGDGTAIGNLLDFIGKFESGDNYNILIGSKKKDLTSMTLTQILTFQSNMISQGYSSTAVGKYQILFKTLKDLIKILQNQNSHFNPNTVLFNKKMQDKFAIMLLQRRGLKYFLAGSMNTETFAKNLALEWASLPTSNSKSYYQTINNNKAGTTWPIFENTLTIVRNQYVSQNTEIASTSKSKTPVST